MTIAKSVFCQTSRVDGDYRLRELEFLAGVNKTITYYKENGCNFKVDVAKTYFSPRLATERERISSLIEDNEIIGNLFGGVGTFSILIARANSTAKIYSVDSNIFAYKLCAENSLLNKVEGRVISLFGDASQVITNFLFNKCTRILMPLPERAREFVDVAVSSLINGKGVIHYYAHVSAHDRKHAAEKGILDAKEAFKKYNHTIMRARVVREVGPRVYQIACDVNTKI